MVALLLLLLLLLLPLLVGPIVGRQHRVLVHT
jgi:hypothetical protein